MGGVRVILWKELLDLWRDRKTLVSVVLLPMVGLPGLALLTGILVSVQMVSVAIIVEDPGAYTFAEWLADELSRAIEARGMPVEVSLFNGSQAQAGYDLVVVVPRGFSANLSSLDRPAFLVASASLGQGGEAALSALREVVGRASYQVAVVRVEHLAGMAGVTVDPGSVLNPVRVTTGYHTPAGAPATTEEAQVAFTARLLEFALFFVVNPTVVYMTDSIVGERERRTIEKLLMAPVGRREILAGKMAAAAVLGFAASAVDSLGIVLFFLLSGTPVEVTLGLGLAWLASAVVVIFVTAAMVAIVAARSESIRTAQNVSFLLVMAALTVYFAALFVDLARLPSAVSLVLQLVPFTHAALVVHYYALGLPWTSLVHLAVLVLFFVLFLALAVRVFDGERLVSAR